MDVNEDLFGFLSTQVLLDVLQHLKSPLLRSATLEYIGYSVLYIVSYLAAKAMATAKATATATATATAKATATATVTATATATVTAMAMAMAMAMLKMDENVNLRLERHVNRALFY